MLYKHIQKGLEGNLNGNGHPITLVANEDRRSLVQDGDDLRALRAL